MLWLSVEPPKPQCSTTLFDGPGAGAVTAIRGAKEKKMTPEDFLKVFNDIEPMIAGAVSLYPPAAPFVAAIQPFVPKAEQVVTRMLALITSRNGGDPAAAFL